MTISTYKFNYLDYIWISQNNDLAFQFTKFRPCQNLYLLLSEAMYVGIDNIWTGYIYKVFVADDLAYYYSRRDCIWTGSLESIWFVTHWDFKSICRQYLHNNWWRFTDYSHCGSLLKPHWNIQRYFYCRKKIGHSSYPLTTWWRKIINQWSTM